MNLTHDFKFQAPDGQSKKKAYTFLQSNLVADEDIGTTKSLQQIHAYIFGGLYDFAGKIRAKTMTAKCSWKASIICIIMKKRNEAIMNTFFRQPYMNLSEIPTGSKPIKMCKNAKAGDKMSPPFEN